METVNRAAEGFEKTKELMMSSQLFVYFNPKLEIHPAHDALAYGVGAMLSHKMPDGSEQSVGFASRTLTETEKKCSQMEKEALACVYGVKHTSMRICWAINLCCRQIMSHYGLSSVNLKQFHHTHPTGIRGGHGPLHHISIRLSAERQVSMPMQMP